MTTTAINFVPAKFVEDSQTAQYTVSAPEANSVRAIIDSAVVTNVGSSAALFSCNLVTNTGSAGNSNLFIDEQRIEPGESYLCPEIISQVLEDGDFISTLSSLSNALSLRISGRLITT